MMLVEVGLVWGDVDDLSGEGGLGSLLGEWSAGNWMSDWSCVNTSWVLERLKERQRCMWRWESSESSAR